MNTRDLEKAISLGVDFRFQFIGSKNHFGGWALHVALRKDNDDEGQFIKTARGEHKRYKSLDTAIAELIRIGIPTDCASRITITIG